MKLDKLAKRIQSLEPDVAAVEARKRREILSRLTYEELCQLETACIRTQEWKLPLTDDEACFVEELRTKYAIS
jgi:hypothetical protein